MSTDVIDLLAGIEPGSGVDGLRRRREQARDNAQASYAALFAAPGATGVTSLERTAVAAFVAALHGPSSVRDHYRDLLAAEDSDLAERLDALAASAAAEGPYGNFPATADLRDEDAPGPVFCIDTPTAEALGSRLAAALEHAHLLVFRPRESSPDALASLVGAGWATPQIVTLSQLVAFLAFQLRVVHGLAALRDSDLSEPGVARTTPGSDNSDGRSIR